MVGICVTRPSQGPHVVQHGEHTSGALWYSKVRPAEVAEVVDGAGDTGLDLGKGRGGDRGREDRASELHSIVQSPIYFSNKSLTLHIPVHPPKTAHCPTHCPTHCYGRLATFLLSITVEPANQPLFMTTCIN